MPAGQEPCTFCRPAGAGLGFAGLFGGIMRKLLIALAILIVTMAGGLFVAVLNINTYLANNRELLTAEASAAVGRDVSFERAEVAFSSGLAVRLVGLEVSEDPRFGEPNFLSLDEAYVGVRILPALSRRIEVSGIRFDSPTIRVIQTADGFNFSSLGGTSESPPAPSSAPPSETEDAEPGAPLAVAIALFEIVDGTIVYEDRTSPDGLSLVIEGFETSGTDLSLDGPLSIDFAGRIHSTKASDAGLESPLAGEIDLVSLETISGTLQLRCPSLHPAIFGVRLEEGGEIERLVDLVVDVELPVNFGKVGIPVAIRSSDARLSGFDLENIAIDVVYRAAKRGSEVKLEQVTIGLAGGTVILRGDIVLGKPGNSPFDLTTKIDSIDSGELATALMGVPAGALSGSLGGDIALKGDSLEWESLKKTLVGRLSLDVGEGALEQVNILNKLVGGLTSAPGLGQIVAASIRDIAPDALSGNRTAFEGINMALEILDGAVHAKDLSLSAGDFSLQAAGKVGLDGAVAANGKIVFSEELSGKILAKADQLGPLLGDDKQVTIPLRIGGTTESPTLLPDLSALTGKAKEELKNRAAEALADAIFGKNRDGEEPAKKADRDSAEGLIKEGLGRLLGR